MNIMSKSGRLSLTCTGLKIVILNISLAISNPPQTASFRVGVIPFFFCRSVPQDQFLIYWQFN